jgi:hypothetical protein
VLSILSAAEFRELLKAFNIPYIYDYITKLCRQQAEVIQNHENANVRLNLAAVKSMTVQVSRLLL